ncbi:MAG: alpha/beta fold hydrolase [Actinocatenispora sp.]
MAEPLLLCFPYAGGSAVRIYREWIKPMAGDAEVVPVELPGRGSRLVEPLLTRIDAITDDVLTKVLPRLDRPYALFGHSLGALVAFELARRLEHRYARPAMHLFVSGHDAPHLTSQKHDDYLLPEDEFRARLRELAGTPEEVLADEDLLGLLVPIIRADFEAADTYEYRAGPKLTCPVTVYGGSDDPEAPPDTLPQWAEQTLAPTEVRVLPGNHFFLHHQQSRLLSGVAGDLAAARTGVAVPTPGRTF